MYACMHACMYVCMYLCICIHLSVCASVYLSVYPHALCMYVDNCCGHLVTVCAIAMLDSGLSAKYGMCGAVLYIVAA